MGFFHCGAADIDGVGNHQYQNETQSAEWVGRAGRAIQVWSMSGKLDSGPVQHFYGMGTERLSHAANTVNHKHNNQKLKDC